MVWYQKRYIKKLSSNNHTGWSCILFWIPNCELIQSMILKKKRFKLINNLMFSETFWNNRKQRDVPLVTNERARSKLALSPRF